MDKRIRTKTSRTAEMKCMERAISYYEKDPHYRSDDYVAPAILPGFLKGLAKLGVLGPVYRRLTVKGIYEYVIARTKYIDDVFGRSLGGVEQVLVLGAGFDTRAIRFGEKAKHAKYFEFDSPVTQGAKVEQLRRRKIAVPSTNVTFVPVDFDREPLSRKLEEHGVRKGVASLFLLEGVTMYLEPGSIDATFRLISEYAGPGSLVVFDYVYASVVRGENLYEGEKEVSGAVAKAGEKFTFGIEKGGVGPFLSGYGLALIDEATADELENRYFAGLAGRTAGRVTGTHSLVTAKK